MRFGSRLSLTFASLWLSLAAGDIAVASSSEQNWPSAGAGPLLVEVELSSIQTMGVNSGGGLIARDVTMDSKGRIVVLGDDDGGHVAIVRYTPNGQLDRDFGPYGDGAVIFLLPQAKNGRMHASTLVTQADGSLLVAGTCQLGDDAPVKCVFATDSDATSLAHYSLGELSINSSLTDPDRHTSVMQDLQRLRDRVGQDQRRELPADLGSTSMSAIAGIDCSNTRRVWQISACGMDDLLTIVKTGDVRRIRGTMAGQLKRARKNFLAADRLVDDAGRQKKFEKRTQAGTAAFERFGKLYASNKGQKHISFSTRQDIQAAVQTMGNRILAVVNPAPTSSPSPSPTPRPPRGTKR